MKKVTILNVFAILIVLLFQTSCSIEKRRYLSGFYVESNFNKNEKTKHLEKQTIANIVFQKNLVENCNAAKNTNIKPQLLIHQSAEYHLTNTPSTNLAYYKTNYADNKTNFIHNKITHNNKITNDVKSELKQFNKNEAFKVSKANQKASDNYSTFHSSKYKNDKNQIIALLLCFFLGMLGIHSFYLGNTKKGIWQLVMFLVGLITFFIFIGYLIWAALYIWVLIDFIRLIIGDLGPGW